VDSLVYTDELNSIRVITRAYAERHWTREEMTTFDTYAWPLGKDTYAIWDIDSIKWKPINHSCDPNCWMFGLETRARRAIRAGEELTLDYATFLPDHPAFNCWCGSELCRKQLKPGDFREPWFAQRYNGHCSPYIQEKLDKILQETNKPQTASDGQTETETTTSTTIHNKLEMTAKGTEAGLDIGN